MWKKNGSGYELRIFSFPKEVYNLIELILFLYTYNVCNQVTQLVDSLIASVPWCSSGGWRSEAGGWELSTQGLSPWLPDGVISLRFFLLSFLSMLLCPYRTPCVCVCVHVTVSYMYMETKVIALGVRVSIHC